MKSIARGLGHVAMFTVAAALITVASLFIMGAYLTTWPILRTSPRNRKVRATVDLASAGMTFLSIFQQENDTQLQEDE